MHRISLNLVSADALDTIHAAMRRAPDTTIVTSLDDVPRALEEQAARLRLPAVGPDRGLEVDLDLIGHSTRAHHLLRIGATAIDLLDLGVRRFFEQLARTGLLGAVNAISLRLLGCETAISPSGRRTLGSLAAMLRIPVYGTRKPLNRLHYTARGFQPRFRSLLVEGCPSGPRTIGATLAGSCPGPAAVRLPPPGLARVPRGDLR
ncbi:MAG TPA: hypothetical protein VFT22_27310 [Kofleriaceae bacterium]|nr:hypothetical protein [Kofleriaceae bacterium]